MEKNITFITKRSHNVSHPNITITSSLEPLYDFLSKAKKENKLVGYDKETTGLLPYVAKELIDSFGDENNQYVVDRTSVDILFINEFSNITYVGHNIKYDFTVAYVNGFEFKNVYDTLIVERNIRRGFIPRNSLEETYKRRCGKEYPIPKSTRDKYIGANLGIVFDNDDVLYSAADIYTLFEIKEQQDHITRYNKIQDYLYNIAFPLQSIIGKCELEGLSINVEKWSEIIKYNKIQKLTIEKKLDEIIKERTKGISKYTGGKFSTKRRKEEVIQKGLFGDTPPVENVNTHNVNYNSSKQILEIFRDVEGKTPMTRDAKTYELKPSMSSGACEEYIYDNPNSNMKEFLTLFIKHSEYSKAINSFGYKFLHSTIKTKSKTKVRGYLNSITGKVHTNYKLETTQNGRFASGDTKLGLFNSQQVPKEVKYRECFTLTQQEIDDGYWITTADLSGAELIILAALSGDKKLIKLQSEDIHSYLATAAYNKIIDYIFTHIKNEERIVKELHDLFRVNKVYNSIDVVNENGTRRPLHPLEEDAITSSRIDEILKTKKFTVNKKDSKDLRDSFKNVVYGSTYGATSKKIAKTLNIAAFYGEIVLKSMKEELPIAFNFLDNASKFGVKNGYIIFNNITNNRCWFPDAVYSIKEKTKLGFREKGNIERACKNYKISGTQADMIKHSIVEIDKMITEDNKDCQLLLQVHDELVYKHKDKEYGKKIASKMQEIANLYLNGITEMHADFDTLHTWTK